MNVFIKSNPTPHALLHITYIITHNKLYIKLKPNACGLA